MSTTRRSLLGTLAAAAALAPRSGVVASGVPSSRCKAIAFDGFAIIDANPVTALVKELFPGSGDQLASLWRSRQFEYTWLRTLSNRYVDFWTVTREALMFAADSLGIELTADARERLMQKHLGLTAWPDALPALRALKGAGIRMRFLANLTAPMLDAVLRNAALATFFEDHLTTDIVRAFKPHPRAYQMAVSAFGCERDEIVFVASAAWDAAGAKWFGYPTFWVNRPAARPETLDATADAEGRDMDDLVRFVLGDRAGG